MKNDKLKASVLAVKIIPNISDSLAEKWNLPDNHKSVGILTLDSDDVGYAAIDEATKKADVVAVLAKSFYAGAANATQKYTGEFIAILSGPTPAEVKSGLTAALDFVENDAAFISANEDDSVAYFSHCISRTGSFLSKQAGIKEGEALGYLIAPPLEASYALDVALKSADVKLVAYFEPPSKTNFSGGYVTGSQSACKAACDAFSDAVVYCAENPTKF